MRWLKTNRWALTALLERDPRNKSEFCRDVGIAPSTLTGLLSGRRDGSDDLLAVIAAQLGVPVQAVSSDPYRLLPPVVGLLREAERLVAAGVDGGLREALDGCRKAGLK